VLVNLQAHEDSVLRANADVTINWRMDILGETDEFMVGYEAQRLSPTEWQKLADK